MKTGCPFLIIAICGFLTSWNGFASQSITHGTLFYEEGRFGGWPANHGIWSWGDEVLVGFGAAYFKDRGPERHAVDSTMPEEHLLARSQDGGESWLIENPAEQGSLLPRGAMLFGTPPENLSELKQQKEPIDFLHPDFAITFRMEDHRGGGSSRYYYSYDRGKTWRGPFELPLFGTPGIASRSDYIIDDKKTLTLFTTAGKANGREGRTLAVRTLDGGLSWDFLSWIGPEPSGFRIMPSTLRIDEATLFSTTRSQDGSNRRIEGWISRDNGSSWELQNESIAETGRGNPPSLLRLQDGRFVIIYGYRAEPYGIRARISPDQGRTWGEEIILREDAANWDIGYPASIVREDGKVLTTYYYTQEKVGPERFIAWTIWDPSEF